MKGRLWCFVATMIMAVSTSAVAQEVKIGVLSDMSGTAASIGGPGSIVAAQLAVEDFGGTVDGRKISILSADGQDKPDVSSVVARRWYEQDGVDVIVDVPVSSAALAVQTVAHELHKVLLVSGATTTALTGTACSPWTLHWAEDIYTLSNGMVGAVVKTGGNSWFLVTLDFKFGYELEAELKRVLESLHAQYDGTVKAPFNTSDWSSFILQAQHSKAKIVAIAAGGSDFTNALRAAREFGLVAGGQKLAGILVFLSDIHGLGLDVAQGLEFASSFYWDQNDESRSFAKRFMAKRGVMPTREHAETYAALIDYLSAVKAVHSTDPDKVVAWMRAHEARYFGHTAQVRRDGRVVFPVGLWEVKKPTESKGPWDYLKLVRMIPPDEAFEPLSQACPSAK